MAQVGLPDDMVHIVQRHRNGVIPKLLELFFAIMHIVIVFHGHIELIAGRLGGAESLSAEVAAAHDDPSVAVFREVGGQAQVEFGVKVLGWMNAQLKTSTRNIFAELTDALIHFRRVF